MTKKPQIQKFRETARKLEADPATDFDKVLRAIGRAPTRTEAELKKIARQIRQNKKQS